METVDAIQPALPLGALKYLKKQLGKPFAAKARFARQDPRPSRDFVDASADARHRGGRPVVGTVFVEVIAAGGWTRDGVGDALSDEDCFALLVVDGCVARTSTISDQRVPCWAMDDRRAFRMDVCDPGATLFVGVLDEDNTPLDPDDQIGRCAVALRALAPGVTYDAWFPLTLHASEAEALATSARALVADVPMATACEKHATQKQSRGAIRLRLRVAWSDPAAYARSALRGLLLPHREPAYVATPNNRSGDKLRENCRFVMYGVGGCPADPLNEPFRSLSLADHGKEIVDVLAQACRALGDRAAALAPGQDEGATALGRLLQSHRSSLSVGFRSFRRSSRRAIISRNGLEARMSFRERARAAHPQ